MNANVNINVTTSRVAATHAAVLRALPLFSQLPVDVVAQVAGGVREVGLPRGDVLFHRGDPCQGFHCVVAGQVKLAVTSEGGAEKVVEIIGPGETFGEAVMFTQRPYPVTATALTATRLILIPTERIDAVLAADPSFARQMLAGMAIRLHTLLADVEATALKTSVQRVAAFLLAEAGGDTGGDRGGDTGGDGGRLVVLKTSKVVLASRLSLTPETLSRVLRDLSEEGLIRVVGRRIEVRDDEGLAARAGVPAPPG